MDKSIEADGALLTGEEYRRYLRLNHLLEELAEVLYQAAELIDDLLGETEEELVNGWE